MGIQKVFAQVGLLVLHIALVMAIFRMIPDRKIAGLVAGSFFVEVAAVMIWSEVLWGRGAQSWLLRTAVLFLCVSALPVLALRLFYWEIPFDDIQILGITGRQIHQASNWTYLLMGVAALYEGWQMRVRQA